MSAAPADESGGATVLAARCSSYNGFAAFTATGTAINGAYVGPFSEEAGAYLGAGSLSSDLEPRPVRAAGHRFAIDSPAGRVFGTTRAVQQADAAACAKPYFDTAALYLSYFPNTRYAARIETGGAVYVDRGDGFAAVDIVESLDGATSANTQTFLDRSDEALTRLLRRRDCRRGGFAELAYPRKRDCRAAADANPAG